MLAYSAGDKLPGLFCGIVVEMVVKRSRSVPFPHFARRLPACSSIE
jgi:hypothetical protein